MRRARRAARRPSRGGGRGRRRGRSRALGLAAPAGRSQPIRVAIGDGLRHVEIGAADAVTVLDPAAAARALRPPGPADRPDRAGRRRGSTWSGRAARRTWPASALEVRRGPLRVGTRDYRGALEVWRRARGCSSSTSCPGGVRGGHGPRGGVRAVADRGAAGARGGRADVRGVPAEAERRQALPPGGGQPGPELRRAGAEGSRRGRRPRTTAGQVLTWQGGCSRPSTTRTPAASPRPPRPCSRGTASRRCRGSATSSPWTRPTTRGRSRCRWP